MGQKGFEGIGLRAHLPNGTLVDVGKAERGLMTAGDGVTGLARTSDVFLLCV